MLTRAGDTAMFPQMSDLSMVIAIALLPGILPFWHNMVEKPGGGNNHCAVAGSSNFLKQQINQSINQTTVV